MKPKTKLQKKIVALSDTLPKFITKEQKRWAEEKCFKKYFVRSRKTQYCLECGGKWKPEVSSLSSTLLGSTCPDCGEKLTQIKGWERHARLYEYWAVLTTVKEYQVVRMYRTRKYLKKNQPAQYYHREVMQHWVGKKGSITTLSALCQSMGFYCDSFIDGGPLEVRSVSHGSIMRARIAPYKIYPKRKVQPLLRRNGFKGYFYKEPPHHVFAALLKHQKAETLLKAGQVSLFKEFIEVSGTHERIEKYWPSICIAMRNEYIVEDASIWMDYLDMLIRFNKDIRSPHYICSGNLKKAHDRYNRRIEAINRKARIEELKLEMEKDQVLYEKSKSMFFDLHIIEGRIEIVPFKSVQEFYEEGDILRHCIFNNRYYKKQHCLLLSARIKGKPVETVEVDLEQLKVTQARGMENKPTKRHGQIVKAVMKNMNEIAKRARKKSAKKKNRTLAA